MSKAYPRQDMPKIEQFHSTWTVKCQHTPRRVSEHAVVTGLRFDLEIATKLGFFDLHLKGAMDEIRERTSVADEMLDDRLVALTNEVIQESARIELAQEFDILFRQIAIRQNDIDVVTQRRKIKIVEIIAQCVRAGF